MAAAVVSSFMLEAGTSRVRGLCWYSVLPLRASRTIKETLAPARAGSASNWSSACSLVFEGVAQPPNNRLMPTSMARVCIHRPNCIKPSRQSSKSATLAAHAASVIANDQNSRVLDNDTWRASPMDTNRRLTAEV